MTDLFWDEVLLTNNPDSKELEVSFKKIDGDGFITSAGGEPGTPGGATEGPDGVQEPAKDDEGDFEDDVTNPGGDEPILPEEPPLECQEGADCESRWLLSEGLEYAGYNSLLFMRDGYPDTGDADGIFYYGQSTDVEGTGRDSNVFELYDRNLNVVFDGTATSEMPTVVGTQSDFMLRGVNTLYDNPNARFDRPASPANVGDTTKYYANGVNMSRYQYRTSPGGDASCGGDYFCAPTYTTSTGWKLYNRKRSSSVGSIWYEATEVPDPTNTENPSKWVGEGTPAAGAEMEHVEWHSIFVMGPHVGGPAGLRVPSPASRYDLNYRKWSLNFIPSRYVHTSNQIFGDGNTDYERNIYTGSTELYVDPFGKFRYQGSAGAGGGSIFESRRNGHLVQIPDLNEDGWYSIKYETYISAAKKDTNESGDYGIYDYGVTLVQQRWATWFFNGIQVTPRFMCSQFTRPQANTGPTFIAHDPNIPIHEYLERQGDQQPSYGSVNAYFRDKAPLEFSAYVRATWISKPIVSESLWDANHDPSNQSYGYFLREDADVGRFQYIISDGPSVYNPIIAYVEHSDAGESFFGSQQFKARIKTFETRTPPYCSRIP